MINLKGKRKTYDRGLTLIELIIGMAIVGILASIAVPAYNQYVDKGRAGQAVQDIGVISAAIQKYYTENFRYPDSLSDVGMDSMRDPWDNLYRYLNLADQNKRKPEGARKDRKLKPLNADFDLYSVGKDGQTKKSINHKRSHDDIIRANSGGYIGMACDY